MNSANLTGQSLIRRILSEDEQERQIGWEEFNRFYWRLITSWARAMGCSPSIAEDIYQNTSISLLKNLSSFENKGEPGAFRKWLKTIVQRRVRDYYRWEMKHSEKENPDRDPFALREMPTEEIDTHHGTPDVNVTMDRIWLRNVMDTALQNVEKRIKPQKYEIFRRYVIYEEPVKKLSEEFGVAEGTIFQQRSHVLDLLREETLKLLERFQDHTQVFEKDSASKKAFKNLLEDYLSGLSSFRDTIVEEETEKSNELLEFLYFQMDAPQNFSESACLFIVDQRESRWIPLHNHLELGRNSTELPLKGQGVSGRHAEIYQEQGHWFVKDLNSTNGVWLNQQRIGERELLEGDWILLGNETAFAFFEGK
ncbi:MAG: sigma-70 family RNA polymerase sigma factor [Lentisphaeria bacterium]|nr:sigma-70 family RNA polymerase sigma factor [Lentisphaeria bacterium]